MRFFLAHGTRACVLLLAIALPSSLAACGSSTPGAGGPTVPAVQRSTARGGSPTAGSSTATPTTWTQYHANAARTGAVASSVDFAHARRAWSDDLGGTVHGQVVVADGRVVAATERDRVVALNPRTGEVIWSRSIGRPLTAVARVAGCGDIAPLGITSTPVIDTATQTVYVVGEIRTGRDTVEHRLVGLSLSTGAVRLSEDVDPPLPDGEHAAQLLQRAGLALGNGRVYIAYGGNDGDCGAYHGWVVGVREQGAADRVTFEVASDGQGGAIWQSGGAPAMDSAGDLYVSTGNANPDPPHGGPDPKRYTESVVELSPTLHPLASYKDRTAGGDEDLSTGNPVLLPGGRVFSVGKTDTAFVLRSSTLSRLHAIHGVCGSNPDGGPAFDAALDTVFVPCRGGGIDTIDVHTFTRGHRLAGADSSPVLVGSHLWSLDQSSGRLVEFDARTGRRLQDLAVGTGVPEFASPTVALGLLLVPTDEGVTAFR